jgi:hypothetical protein
MSAVEIPFATYEGASVVEQNSRETLVNMFAEIEVSGRKKLIRRQRPGVAVALANSGTKRCIEKNKSTHYTVIGDTFYSFDGSSLTSLGTLGTATGRCTMAFNENDEILISDGATAYYWNGASLAALVTPTDVGNLAYMSGYAVYNDPDTGQFYSSTSNDFSTIDALDFATAESYTDNLVRPFVDHNELWLFGTNSTEVWQLSGSSDFPFARFTNAQIERGCGAAFSVAADDNTVFWLGDDGVFYRADGYRPQRISTHPVERAVADLSAATRAGADAFIYTIGGHKFYTVRFDGYLTLQYNIATGFWNRAKTYGYDDWRIMGSAGRYSDYFMTPTAIATLTPGLCTDEGGIMVRGGVSAPGYAEGKRISVRSFFLDAEVGRAPISTDANVMLRVARDGETFGNVLTRSLGETGDYRRRAIWRNLGQGRNWVLELMFSDPSEFAIVSTHADIHVSSS